MTSVSKNVYIDKLDNIVNGYNNIYYRAIKMKPVVDNTYVEILVKKLMIKIKAGDHVIKPKFKAGDHVIIPKYRNIFAKRYTPNWPEEAFVIKKVKI